MAWTIGASSVFAKRSDGVEAFYCFGGAKPYAVWRGPAKKKEWMAGNYISVRVFKTLQGAMRAADKTWPL